MTPASFESVFGRDRLKMVTGEYVDVHREAAAPGERRRYTKRFLSTAEGDFTEWTEREWRILARLVGHGVKVVPDVVQFDRGSAGGKALVQTYDAGITLHHWETLLPVERDGSVLRHVFQDSAHWWALAHHLLLALKEIHQLRLVHLDLKADNVCVPLAPTGFNPRDADQQLFAAFRQLALIDFAFSMVTGEPLDRPLPIGWQQEYPYQSPRLLKALLAGRDGDLEPTRELDWRCDMFSLAAMLKRYLPGPEGVQGSSAAGGWTDEGYLDAKVLILKIRDCHDRPVSEQLPHDKLIEASGVWLGDPNLASSLSRGWTLAADRNAGDAGTPGVPLTPITRIEPQRHIVTLHDEVVMASADSGPTLGSETPTGRGTGASAASEAGTGFDRLGPQGTHPASSGDAHPVPVAALDALSANPKPWRLRRTLAFTIPLSAAVIIGLWLVVEERRSLKAQQILAEVSRSTVAATADPARQLGNLPSQADPRPILIPDSPPQQESQPQPGPESDDELAPPTSPLVPTKEVAKAAEQTERSSPSDPKRLPPITRLPPAGDDELAPPAQVALDGFAQHAQEILAGPLPAFAEQAERRIATVLRIAANADTKSKDKEVFAAARSIGELPSAGRQPVAGAASRARQLNEAAREAFWTRRDVATALDLQLEAFGANPRNAEIAGNLAFYNLKTSPPRPEVARQLAIYALATAAARSGPGRVEDWGNLAVASSLSGRPHDATNAMFVLMATSKDLNRSCKSAVSAVASHGQSMKVPSQAMLSRIRSRGGAPDAPYCAWPPAWDAGVKFP